MNRESIRKQNGGYSLIELIIVVAIMAVLLSVISISYFFVGRANSKSYAMAFDRALSTAQNSAMGRVESFDLYFTFDMATGDSFVQIGKTGQKIKVGDKKHPIDFWQGSSYMSITTPLKFTFSKSSGALKAVYFSSNITQSLNYFDETSRLGGGLSEYKIRFGPANGTNYVLHLVTATGKHYVE